MRKGNTVQLQASIPKNLMIDLQDLAIKEKRSISNLVSLLLGQAILDFIKDYPKSKK